MENLIIIGGGPAGLAAAIYAARANLKPLVVEGMPAGGQLTLTSDVENYPGFPKGITGPELVANMRAQAERFGTRFLSENVQRVNKDAKGVIHVETTNGSKLAAPTVLVATGANAMWLGLESETRLRGKGVSACATCDGFFFRNKTVAVLGGGDSALEEANFLTKFATKVYIIHRRDSFRASKIMQERALANPKIEVIWNASVEEILGDKKVEGVKLKIAKLSNGQIVEENEKTVKQFNSLTINLDGVFVAIGHRPATEFLKESGVLLDQKGYIITWERAAMEVTKLKSTNPQIHKSNSNEQIQNEERKYTDLLKDSRLGNGTYKTITSIEGIFAAGDCVDFSYRQATTAVGMGVAAELEVERYLENMSNSKL